MSIVYYIWLQTMPGDMLLYLVQTSFGYSNTLHGIYTSYPSNLNISMMWIRSWVQNLLDFNNWFIELFSSFSSYKQYLLLLTIVGFCHEVCMLPRNGQKPYILHLIMYAWLAFQWPSTYERLLVPLFVCNDCSWVPMKVARIFMSAEVLFFIEASFMFSLCRIVMLHVLQSEESLHG